MEDFAKHFETQQLRTEIDSIPEGAIISISEKIHGTSGRTGYLRDIGSIGLWKKFWSRAIGVICPDLKGAQSQNFAYVSGTRNVTMNPDTMEDGYYSGKKFRSMVHKNIKETGLRPGETVYYEIAGYDEQGLLIAYWGIGALASAVYLSILSGWQVRPRWVNLPHGWRQVLREAVPFAVTGIVAMLYKRIDLLMLAYWQGDLAAGLS